MLFHKVPSLTYFLFRKLPVFPMPFVSWSVSKKIIIGAWAPLLCVHQKPFACDICAEEGFGENSVRVTLFSLCRPSAPD